MSHFSVLVIGPDPEAQLQPFHEFECTGVDDEFVVDVDITAEVRDEYETESQSMYDLPCGTRVGHNDPRMYRDPTADERRRFPDMLGTRYGSDLSWTTKDWGDGLGRRAKVWDMSIGTPAERSYADNNTFAEYIDYSRGEHVERSTSETQYGYVVRNDAGEIVQVFKRTNPNAQWDWWQIGGRWSGFFPVRARAATICEVKRAEGNPDAREPGRSAGSAYADQLMVRDVDFDLAKATDKNIIPYAVVRNGKWTAKGEMGWWGMSSDTVNQDDWAAQVLGLYRDLPPDTLLTLVDCHV